MTDHSVPELRQPQDLAHTSESAVRPALRYPAAVVFDMDGVIFDTERMVQEAWQIVADRHNIPHVKDTCRLCLGLNQYAAADKFCEVYGADFPYWDYKTEMRSVYWNDLYGEHMPIKPGAEELLRELNRRKIPVALASSTREHVVRKELTDAGLIGYFQQVLGGDTVTHSKPHPEIYQKACEALQIDPASAWGIEDAPFGVQAAAAAGLQTIMVPDQVQPTPEIRQLTAAVCGSLTEVLRELDKLREA